MIDTPCDFGTMSTGDATASIGCKIQRADMPLEAADENLCGKRIHCSIIATSKDAAPDQQTLPDMANEFSEVVDVKAVRVTPSEIGVRLTFARSDETDKRLGHFVKRSGRLVITSAEPIPDDDDESDVDTAGNSGEAVSRPIKPARGQKSLLEDAGGNKPLAALIEFGMTKKKIDSLATACGGSTIAKFEAWMRGNEWWHRDIPGIGGEWITKLQDAHLAFRQRFPMPTEEEEKAARDLAEAQQAGRTAFERGYERSSPYAAGTTEDDAWLEEYDRAGIAKSAEGGAP